MGRQKVPGPSSLGVSGRFLLIKLYRQVGWCQQKPPPYVPGDSGRGAAAEASNGQLHFRDRSLLESLPEALSMWGELSSGGWKEVGLGGGDGFLRIIFFVG